MSEISSDLVELIEEATRVFGSAIKAEKWLHSPNIVFGETPVEYLNKSNGKAEVLKVLYAIAYGGTV